MHEANKTKASKVVKRVGLVQISTIGQVPTKLDRSGTNGESSTNVDWARREGEINLV